MWHGVVMRYRGLLYGVWLLASAALAGELPEAVEDAARASQPRPGTVPAASPALVAAAVVAANPDPWQGFNRAAYRFNDTLDRYALKPVARGYKAVTPRPVRTGITNFFANLRMPVVLVNDLLQGKVRAAGVDTLRLVTNSTLGIAGLIDVSTRLGLPQHEEDFGQTLGVWGVPAGPFVVLPFLGPSTLRDSGGQVADGFAHPRSYMGDDVAVGLLAAEVINLRARLLEMEDIVQGDRYLFIRDLYLQRREYLVKDGQVEDPFLDDEAWEEESLDENAGDEARAEPEPADTAPEQIPAGPGTPDEGAVTSAGEYPGTEAVETAADEAR